MDYIDRSGKEKLKKISAFQERVLDIAKEQINAKTDMRMDYELHKEGRSFKWVTFKFSSREVGNSIYFTIFCISIYIIGITIVGHYYYFFFFFFLLIYNFLLYLHMDINLKTIELISEIPAEQRKAVLKLIDLKTENNMEEVARSIDTLKDSLKHLEERNANNIKNLESKIDIQINVLLWTLGITIFVIVILALKLSKCV